jgi:hypothetical protein
MPLLSHHHLHISWWDQETLYPLRNVMYRGVFIKLLNKVLW